MCVCVCACLCNSFPAIVFPLFLPLVSLVSLFLPPFSPPLPSRLLARTFRVNMLSSLLKTCGGMRHVSPSVTLPSQSKPSRLPSRSAWMRHTHSTAPEAAKSTARAHAARERTLMTSAACALSAAQRRRAKVGVCLVHVCLCACVCHQSMANNQREERLGADHACKGDRKGARSTGKERAEVKTKRSSFNRAALAAG